MKLLRKGKVMVFTLIVVLVFTLGAVGLGQISLPMTKSNQGSYYLAADGAGDPPFFPPPCNSPIRP